MCGGRKSTQLHGRPCVGEPRKSNRPRLSLLFLFTDTCELIVWVCSDFRKGIMGVSQGV